MYFSKQVLSQLFTYGMRIRLQQKVYVNRLDLAEILLEKLYRDIEPLYDSNKCSYNSHQVGRHMVEAVRRFGPVWVWPTFPFEHANGYLNKINHGPNKVDIEFANTLKMINAFYILRYKLDDNSVVEAERINDNKKVKLSDKRSIFLKFITPEQQLKSDAIHNLGLQVRQHYDILKGGIHKMRMFSQLYQGRGVSS